MPCLVTSSGLSDAAPASGAASTIASPTTIPSLLGMAQRIVIQHVDDCQTQSLVHTRDLDVACRAAASVSHVSRGRYHSAMTVMAPVYSACLYSTLPAV